MLIEFEKFLTNENIFIWASVGVLPFWLMLIFIPSSKFTSFFVNSVIIPLILSLSYIYVAYQAISMDEDIIDMFKLYLSLENLYTIFATESFLLIFWIHFLAVNLFLGSWICFDGIKYNVSRIIIIPSLILVYFAGPLGLIFYWLIRIFKAKKLGFHE